jgi:cytoskeleton protein RodZ
MEDDNYAALPGIVIARGFVRAYAKLLKLDPVPLLALIAEKAAPSPESLELRRTLSATFTESNLPTAKRSGNGGKWLALVLVLLLLGAGGWLAWREGWLAGLPLPDGSMMQDRPAQRATQGTPDTGSGVPMGQAGEGAAAVPAEPAVPQAPGPALSPGRVPLPAVAPEPAAPAAPSSSAAPAPAIAAASSIQPPAGSESAARTGEKLVLKMREASWIEIRREDGDSVVSRLVPAGSTESFDVQSGTRLVVGNAAGVEATFRGQLLDLNTGAKNNVARLKLK